MDFQEGQGCQGTWQLAISQGSKHRMGIHGHDETPVPLPALPQIPAEVAGSSGKTMQSWFCSLPQDLELPPSPAKSDPYLERG